MSESRWVVREGRDVLLGPCPLHRQGSRDNDYLCEACVREAEEVLREIDLAKLQRRRSNLVLRL